MDMRASSSESDKVEPRRFLREFEASARAEARRGVYGNVLDLVEVFPLTKLIEGVVGRVSSAMTLEFNEFGRNDLLFYSRPIQILSTCDMPLGSRARMVK